MAERNIKSSDINIRTMKRKSENETIYVIFNEADKTVHSHIEIPEEGTGYYLDVLNGEIKKLENNSFGISLVSGEACVIVYTNENLSETFLKNEKIEILDEISEFEITPIEKFEVNDGKPRIIKENIEINKSFSGSALYKSSFKCKVDGDLILMLDNLHYFAKIFVNGNEAGVISMSPYKIRISKEYLKDENELCIVVANTAANGFYYADISKIEKRFIGPYNEQTTEYEKDSLKFGLSKVKICKEI